MSFRNCSNSRIVAAFSLAYAAILGTACYLKFATFQYTDFDLAVHAQSVHNMVRGSIDCSILGTSYLGNHMVPILALAAPLYAIFPSPMTLLLLQTLILAAGAVAVFLYAKRHLPAPYPSILSVAYLLYPPLALMNLYEFHPITFASTFLLFALLAYDQKRSLRYAIFLLLAMACQENVSLIVMFLGIKAVFDRRRAAWSVAPIAVGALWFCLCVLWLMPRLNPGLIRFDAIYGHFGSSLPEIAAHILRHPVTTLKYALTPPKLLYLGALLLPLSLTPLAAPLALLPALPVFAQRLLSSRASESTILFHYQAELIPFLFAAAIHGIAKLKRWRTIDTQKIAVVCIVALTVLAVDMTNVPTSLLKIATTARTGKRLTALRRQLVSQIGRQAAVVATFRYLPHLAGRKNLHSLHHIYTGYYTISDVPYPTPNDIDLVLIDRDDPLTFGRGGFFTEGGHTNIQHLLEINRMAPILEADKLLVLARVQTGSGQDDTAQPVPSL